MHGYQNVYLVVFVSHCGQHWQRCATTCAVIKGFFGEFLEILMIFYIWVLRAGIRYSFYFISYGVKALSQRQDISRYKITGNSKTWYFKQNNLLKKSCVLNTKHLIWVRKNYSKTNTLVDSFPSYCAELYITSSQTLRITRN